MRIFRSLVQVHGSCVADSELPTVQRGLIYLIGRQCAFAVVLIKNLCVEICLRVECGVFGYVDVRRIGGGTCVFRLFQPNHSRPAEHVTAQPTAIIGLWAISSTGSSPQPPLVTYNLCVYYCRTYYMAVCGGWEGDSEGHVL